MPDELPDHANADQTAYWNASAGETWAALQDRLDRQIDPLGRRAIAALSPLVGEAVLDVGCGCGQTSLELAGWVGGSGRVLGLDVSRPMLTVARQRAAPAEAVQPEFIEGDAQTYAFKPGSFDAAFSRFGVMFFSEPSVAFANIRSALRGGGRLAFVCWRGLADNDWMRIPLAAGLQHLAAPPAPDPFAPGPFAFSDPARVTAILSEASFEDIVIEAHDQKIGAGDLDETVATALKVGPLGALLRETPEHRDAIVATLGDTLRPYLTPQGVMMNSATWIVRAHSR